MNWLEILASTQITLTNDRRMSADMISKKCRVVIAGHDRLTYVGKVE